MGARAYAERSVDRYVVGVHVRATRYSMRVLWVGCLVNVYTRVYVQCVYERRVSTIPTHEHARILLVSLSAL